MIDIHEEVTAVWEQFHTREGFVFTQLHPPANVYDALVIRRPDNLFCFSPRIPQSSRSLRDHIDLVHQLQIESAMIVVDNLDFITQCPLLRHLKIIPADNVGNHFDYSPLYSMPQIKSLRCRTVYGAHEEFATTIDCSKLNGLEDIHVVDDGYLHYSTVETLKSLGLTGYKGTDLSNVFSSRVLDTLWVFESKIKTLDGIQKSPKMQCLYLYYNRSLQDISALSDVKTTLRALRIDHCPKVTDFSVLGELEALEFLDLCGNNTLPDLSFLKTMKNLKTLYLDMNVKDGDLSLCKNLSFACSYKDRKHFNLRNADLPKCQIVKGDESLELWRRSW